MQEVFEKIIEQLEERTLFLSDCTKYGNKDTEQQNKSYSTMMMYEVADLVEDLIDIVKRVAAEYNNGWIPVKEDNLPKDREDVLILWGGGNRSTAYHVSGGAGGWFFNFGFDYKGNTKVPYEPYAWQPLPESYRPKGKQDHRCDKCKYSNLGIAAYPCAECDSNVNDLFEPKGE